MRDHLGQVEELYWKAAEIRSAPRLKALTPVEWYHSLSRQAITATGRRSDAPESP